MEIENWLAGNFSLGVALAGLVALLLWANRGFLGEIAADPDRGWRWTLRWAGVLIALLLAWTSLFDNWRQLVEEPIRLTKRFAYQRVVIVPTPEALRAVTVVLLVVGLVLVAALFARHVGGYALQVVVFLGAAIFWAPLYAVRRQLDIILARGVVGDDSSPTEVVGYLFFVVLDWLAVGALLLASYAMLAMVIALPLTVLLDLTRLRRPRVTGEAGAFFEALAGRAAAVERERSLNAGR